MTAIRLGLFSLLCSAMALVGCASDPSAPGSIGGSLRASVGHTVPESANVYVVWTVSSSSPDYQYAFGSGTSTGGRFVLPLGAPPPAEALNMGELGVGLIVLVPEGTTLSEGILEDAAEEEFEGAMLGASPRHAIIYRASATSHLDWDASFPVGEYSCGQAVERPTETFDAFEPVDCSEVIIEVGDPDDMDFANWT